MYDRQRIDDAKNTDILQVVEYLVGEVRNNKIVCPFHDDGDRDGGSLHVYEDGHVHCFGCGVHYDAIDFVREYHKTVLHTYLSFDAALRWLEDFKENESAVAVRRKAQATPIDPDKWVRRWAELLRPEHYDHLLSTRLLTPDTIRRAGIGWRPDLAAYSIPYWSGIPFESEIDIVQFRSTEHSPGGNWRYRGLKGRNHPSVLNRHLINSDLVVVLIGTFDALLGEQDGLPTLSLNGASTYADTESPAHVALKTMLSQVRKVVVVPDVTIIEHEAAQKLALSLGGVVRYFPRSDAYKDYNEYRLTGRTPEDFIREVLDMEKFFTWLQDEKFKSLITDFFTAADKGSVAEVKQVLTNLLESGYTVATIVYAVQLVSFDPPNRYNVSLADWAIISDALDGVKTPTELHTCLESYTAQIRLRCVNDF